MHDDNAQRLVRDPAVWGFHLAVALPTASVPAAGGGGLRPPGLLYHES